MRQLGRILLQVHPGDASPLLNAIDLYIGDRNIPYGGGASFLGTIDEVSIYNTVLTPAQIMQHYYLGASQIPSIGISGMRLQGVRVN